MARDNGQAAAGGVIRDMDGKWIIGFNHYLRNCNPLEAELWGIMDGLLFLLQYGFAKATIQTDSLEAFQLLTQTGGDDYGTTIYRRTRRTPNAGGQWYIQFVLRERN